MISSMTAFARTEHTNEKGNMVCEMRSINHRYLEVHVHLPDALRILEMPMREAIRQHVKRGKVECTVRCQIGTGALSPQITINAPLAQALCRLVDTIASYLTQPAPVPPTTILQFAGVLETQPFDLLTLQPDVFHLVERTTQELVAARLREGKQLMELILQRMDLMHAELTSVRARFPQISQEQRERLRKRFVEAQVEVDPVRLEQEMVLFAQRIDVSEETDRLETHIAEVRRIVKQGGPVGRRLDFLLQELNREANTLGSKSVDTVLTHVAVEMKVLIEQVREQVQNVE